MALSASIKGRPMKKITSGLQDHQERFSEKEGKAALKNSDSKIDVTQTKYNKLLFKSDVLKDCSAKKFVSSEFEKVNEKRKSMGLRGFRPDSNTIGMGNFQISDDTLEKLGFDKSKKWDEQTEQAQNNVVLVYQNMVRNAVSKPDIYGRVLTATLHVDESTPHVDFITTGVDAERPDWSLREVLNGKEWRDEEGKRRFPPKGAKLRAMQDDLNTIFSEEYQKQFGLTRGKPKKESVDYAVKTRKAMKQLEDRESLVEARESTLNEKADNLSIREKKLVEAENELSRSISKNKAKEQELDEREQVLDKRENSWNDDLSRLQQAQMRLIQENQAIKQESERLDAIEPNRLDRAVLDLLKNSSAKSGGSLFDYYKKFAEQRFRDRVKTGVQDAVSEYDKSKQPYGGPSKPSTGPTGPSL